MFAFNIFSFYIMLKISYFCDKISTGIFSQLNIIVNILVYQTIEYITMFMILTML